MQIYVYFVLAKGYSITKSDMFEAIQLSFQDFEQKNSGNSYT